MRRAPSGPSSARRCSSPRARAATPAGPRLRVTILGRSADPRVLTVREAIAHWTGELRRLGRHVQLDSGTVHDDRVPDAVLRATGGEAVVG